MREQHDVMRAALVLVAAAALTIASCGSKAASIDERVGAANRASAAEDRKAGFAERAEVLEDGVLTDAEVDELFADYRECMAKAGQEVVNATRSPIDGRTWLYDIGNFDTLGPDDGERQYQCVIRFSTDSEVSLDPGPMAVDLRRYVATCLDDQGLPNSPDDRDLRAIYRRVGVNHDQELRSCIEAGMRTLYPKLGFQLLLPEVM